VVGTLKTISAQTAIRVTESAAETGSFTATLSGDTSVTVGENVEMDITVSGSDFAAAAFSLTYDTALLELASADGFDCSDTNGKVTVVDFGTTKEAPYTYHVTFRAISDGTAAVTLTEASFGSSGSAETDNMTSAEIASQSVAVTIEKRKFSVSLPDIFAGDDTVIDGQTYTFEATDAIHYNYGTVTATMGGGSSFTVTPGEDGSYSIANVTGNLVIQGSRTAKQYRVTFQTDTDAELPVDEVIVYGTDFSETKDYVFVVPEEDNYKVSVTSVTCNGEPVEFTRDNNTVTISGDTICGDLVVKLDRTRINADVTVDGNASGELTIHSSVAVPGTDYSVTLNADPRYTYTVTATVNGKAVILTKAGNVYTIDGDDVKLGEIIFTVEKTLNVNFDISEYLAFDGTMVWLVQNKVEQVENTVYTYAGQNMLWSEAYDSYCCLVIASTSQDITADKLAFRSGTTDSVDYGKDVNASGKVDMNDAQLVYNLYQAVYESFTDTVTMEKVLCADVNGDGKVDTEDAVAIVAEILG